MTDLLHAVNPWHLMWDALGWVVLVTITLCLGIVVGASVVSIVKGFLKGFRTP